LLSTLKNHLNKQELDYNGWVFACFPEKLAIETFSVEENKYKLFTHEIIHMIFTDANRDLYYWTFLKFKELVLRDGNKPLIAPKSICLISNDPIFSLQRQLLKMIFKKVIFKNNVRSFTALYDDPMNHLLSVTMAVQIEIKDNIDQFLQNQLEYYLSFWFHFLHLPPNLLNCELHWDDDQILRYQNNVATKSMFTVENFTYELLLTRVRPYRILELVGAILQERPIFLIDDNMDDMAIIIKSLLSLVKPFNWMNPIVPIIPASLAHIIGSPMGTLIGIHSEIWKEHWKQVEELLSEDAYVLFLNEDSNIWENKLVEIPGSDKLEEFLYYFRNTLNYPDEENKAKSHCKKIFNQIGIKRELNTDDFLIFSQLKIDLEFFFKVLCKNFTDVAEYINIDKNIDDFVESSPKESKEFNKSVVHTQIFSSFIDKAIRVRDHTLPNDEKDSEKIEYFFECLSFCKNTTPHQLRQVMNRHLKDALKDYYFKSEKTTMSEFSKNYHDYFVSKFTGKIDPKNYLIKETVIHNDKQLSLVEGFNEKMIMKDLPRPFIDEKSQHTYEVKWDKSRGSQTYDSNKLIRSKSSQNIKVETDINEEHSPDLRVPEKSPWKEPMNAEEKRKAFKSKKLGKTQCFETANIDTDFNAKRETKLTSSSDGFSSSTMKSNPKFLKSESKNFDSSTNIQKLWRSKKSKSFKHKNFEAPKTSLTLIRSNTDDFQRQRSFKQCPQSSEVRTDSVKNKYTRKHRNSKAFFIDNSTLKPIGGVEKRRNYRTNTLIKKGVCATQDNSPCNVSKNMKKFNNDTFRSKKFLQSIDTEVYSSNYEIIDKNQLELQWKELAQHSTSSKENAPAELASACTTEIRKCSKMGKNKLRRGMTVKFQEDEEILSRVEKNHELVRKFCKTKSFKKKLSLTRGTSECNIVKG